MNNNIFSFSFLFNTLSAARYYSNLTLTLSELSLFMMFLSMIPILVVMQNCQSARILGVFPVPSISHQVVFRPLVHELARRGHDVVAITTDPALKPGETRKNFKEIDVSTVSYSTWKKKLLKNVVPNESLMQLKFMVELFNTVTEEEMRTDEIQELVNNETEKFDLVIWECSSRMALIFSFLYNVSAIGISSAGGFNYHFDIVGASSHPIVYPDLGSRRVFNLTITESIWQLYYYYIGNYICDSFETTERETLNNIFGIEIPSYKDMKSRIRMLFLNNHPIWDSNRPAPRGMLYLGNLHEKPLNPLPQDLKTYLDLSVKGVIYLSFGTNFNTSLFPTNTVKIFTKVFSHLPYDILVKWNEEELLDQPENVKISKWLPQSDLLRHPNIKLFITQGGLQSTDEAITAGVPLVGIPLSSDQWYNVQKYVYHGVGVQLDLKTLTEEKLMNAIETVITNKSYRQNMIKLRSVMRDQQYTSLEHAVLWTEYILKNGESVNLHGAATDKDWIEYFEIELALYTFMIVMILTWSFVYFIKCVIKYILAKIENKAKLM